MFTNLGQKQTPCTQKGSLYTVVNRDGNFFDNTHKDPE